MDAMDNIKGKNTGTVTQIIGPVLDIRFEEGKLPELNNAVTID